MEDLLGSSGSGMPEVCISPNLTSPSAGCILSTVEVSCSLDIRPSSCIRIHDNSKLLHTINDTIYDSTHSNHFDPTARASLKHNGLEPRGIELCRTY